MNKLKIERGASKVRREALKVTIDGTVADELKLMGEWSENDLSYLVNLLLGFAIAQSEDFQKYKSEHTATSLTVPPAAKSVSDQAGKVVSSDRGIHPRIEKGVLA